MEDYKVPRIIQLLGGGGQAQVCVPGSKSITNRALLIAALSEGESRLEGILFSEDSRYLLACLKELGIKASVDEREKTGVLSGCGGNLPVREASLYVGSAGTAARFLTALAGMTPGTWHLDSSVQMRQRPMAPLLSALEDLGAGIAWEGEEGHFPFTIQGSREVPEEMGIRIDDSSQFLSALLIAAAASGRERRIHVTGTHGMSYVGMTVRMLEDFGCRIDRTDDGYRIPGGQRLRARAYRVEPDLSAAAYFFAMAAVLGVSVTVRGVRPAGLQGDARFLEILRQMGCRVSETPEGVCVAGPEGGALHGTDADMHDCSDQAITLAAIAPYADSPVTIRGISHIRFQECDRIAGILENLRRMGISCRELAGGDAVRIEPGQPSPAVVETFEDHRMAMGFSLTGLRAEGIVIRNPGCCRKTFEDYFTVFAETVEQLVKGQGRPEPQLPDGPEM